MPVEGFLDLILTPLHAHAHVCTHTPTHKHNSGPFSCVCLRITALALPITTLFLLYPSCHLSVCSGQALWGHNLCGRMWGHVWKDPTLSGILCCCLPEICYNFLNQRLQFYFVLGPYQAVYSPGCEPRQGRDTV